MDYKAEVNLCTKPGTLKGYVVITLNDEFVVKGLTIREGSNGLFVSMPSSKNGNKYYDAAYPITAEAREKINNAVLNAYKIEIEKLEEQVNAAKQSTQKIGESPDTGKSPAKKTQKAGKDQKNNQPELQETGETEEQVGQTMGGM